MKAPLRYFADYGLTQLVNFLIREASTLELIITNKEHSINNIKFCPGVSDHDMLIFHFYVKPQRLSNCARKIYLYHQADLKFKKGLNLIHNEMISRQNYESIDELWCFFKNSISKLTEDFVPFKYAKNNSGLPWITKIVRREISKKERLFKIGKRSGNQNDATNFKTQRKKVKHIMKVAHDDYVNNCILKDIDKKPKKFWKYIKAKRSSSSVRFTKNCLTKNSQAFTKMKDILNTLNTKFYEAFSKSESAISDTKNSGHNFPVIPDMPNIEVSCIGVEALISRLDDGKATGPDNIGDKLLKLAPAEMSQLSLKTH